MLSSDQRDAMISDVPDLDRSTSKLERRRARIIELLLNGETVQVRDLADQLKVSLMTIHRDLSELEKEGLVRRLRGAVSAEKSLLFESSYSFRNRKQVEEKRRLARAAVSHLEPGNAIVCDDSSTTYHICEFVHEVTPITVITNAAPLLERLREVPDVDLISTGGRFHVGYNGYFGAVCERTIQSFHVDVAIMSTTTIQGLSLFTPDESVVRAKQAMMKIARRRVLLADATKFQFTALNYVAEITDFDLVLLTGPVPEANLDQLRNAGVNFEMV